MESEADTCLSYSSSCYNCINTKNCQWCSALKKCYFVNDISPSMNCSSLSVYDTCPLNAPDFNPNYDMHFEGAYWVPYMLLWVTLLTSCVSGALVGTKMIPVQTRILVAGGFRLVATLYVGIVYAINSFRLIPLGLYPCGVDADAYYTRPLDLAEHCRLFSQLCGAAVALYVLLSLVRDYGWMALTKEHSSCEGELLDFERGSPKTQKLWLRTAMTLGCALHNALYLPLVGVIVSIPLDQHCFALPRPIPMVRIRLATTWIFLLLNAARGIGLLCCKENKNQIFVFEGIILLANFVCAMVILGFTQTFGQDMERYFYTCLFSSVIYIADDFLFSSISALCIFLRRRKGRESSSSSAFSSPASRSRRQGGGAEMTAAFLAQGGEKGIDDDDNILVSSVRCPEMHALTLSSRREVEL